MPGPELIFETIPDEGGFTMSETVALQNAWTLISPDIQLHSRQQFLEFFTDHAEILNKFRDRSGAINMNVLHSHPYHIFYTLEAMISEGLNDATHMHEIVSYVAIQHSRRNVGFDQVVFMADAVGKYLKKVLHRFLSPTLERSIDKIVNIILIAHN